MLSLMGSAIPFSRRLSHPTDKNRKDGAHHIPFSSLYLCYHHSPLKYIWPFRLQDAMWVRISQAYQSVSQVQDGRSSEDKGDRPLRQPALMAVLICVFHNRKKKSGTRATDDSLN